MKILLLIFFTLFLTGCEKIANQIQSIVGGKIQDTYLENVGQGKYVDQVKKNYMKVIENGVNELKLMNDPKISEIYSAIDKHFSDNDMSMYDYNSIMALINEHKRELNLAKSKHSDDVSEFRARISQ